MTSRSDIHFQRGVSLFDFQLQFGSENQCRKHLFQLKWPKGYSCPKCDNRQYYFTQSRNLYQCRNCRHQASLLAGTIFSSTKLPLTTWFLAIYLVSQSKEGCSALKLRRFLGISQTASMRLKHKLQMVMKLADDKRPLRGFVQIDDVYWGGKRPGGKRGRGAEGKTPFVAALQRDPKGHPTFIRFSRVESFSSSEMLRWGQKHLKPSTIVVSDGLACFKSFQDIGHFHYSVITSGRYNSPDFMVFDWLNTIIGNMKNKIKGTYHGIEQ